MSFTQFLMDQWVLVLITLSSGVMLMLPGFRAGTGGIPTAEAVRLVNREKGVLVDVSEPKEYAAGHAIGARNIPFGQLEGASTAGKGGGLPTNKALPIVLLCPTGSRAGRAAGILRKAGYERAVAVSGGTRAWADASLPVEKSAAPA